MMAMYSRTRAIDHDVLNALSAIADSLALGIARKTADAARRSAEERMRSQAEQLEMLHRLGEQLSAELEVAPLVQQVVIAATLLAGAQRRRVLLHAPGTAGDATVDDRAARRRSPGCPCRVAALLAPHPADDKRSASRTPRER